MNLVASLILSSFVVSLAHSKPFTHRKLIGSLSLRNDIIVEFKQGAPIEGLLAATGASPFVVSRFERLGMVTLKPAAVKILDALGNLQDVEYMEEDADYEIGSTPSSTQVDAPWHLDRIDSALDGNYEYELTGNGVEAYLLSTGVKLEHEEFGGRAECAFVPVPFEFTCRDWLGSGTAEMAVLGGETYGVAKDIALKMIKVVNRFGRTRTSIMLAGLNYVADRKTETGNPMVVTMGLSARFRDDSLEKAVNRLVEDFGIPVVVGAGNDAGDACDDAPANAASVLTVGSITDGNELASSSNTGNCVDIYAPGVGLETAGTADSTASTFYEGTGMAAALAAGVAALYLERDPLLDGGLVIESIKRFGVPGILTGAFPNLLLSTAGLSSGTDLVTLPFQINCGGEEEQVQSGVWLADQYFTTGQVYGPIDRQGYGNTDDDLLYTTERFDPNLKYEIPIANGSYTVTTYYSENFHAGVGMREFAIYAEGSLVVDNIDIFKEVGRRYRAMSHTFDVVVRDGVLDLELLAVVDSGKLNALKIVES